MGQDAVNDAMEMGMGDVEDEADDVYNGILGEIGLEYTEADPVSWLCIDPVDSTKERC